MKKLYILLLILNILVLLASILTGKGIIPANIVGIIACFIRVKID